MTNIRRYAEFLMLTAVILTGTIAIFGAHAKPASGPWLGYVKPSFVDYAPSGVPDFDEKQDNWGPAAGVYTWCGPVAVANSLWWLDSEYESNFTSSPVPPPTISDHFPLVVNYSSWDDHSPNNVDPFVRNLAFLMDTDGQQTHDGHMGTRWQDLENGTKYYIAQQGVSKYLDVYDSSFPTFNWISNEILNSNDVVLFLEFYQLTGSGWVPLTSPPSLEAGHFVTCAGVNTTTGSLSLLISDPYQDAYEAGTAPGRSPVLHAYPHNSAIHNDAQYVSQDAYQPANYTFITPPPPPPPPPPPGYPPVALELQGYLQTIGKDATWHAFVRAAVATARKSVPEWPGYIKPSFPDYAPSGVPDFDEKQDNWGPVAGAYTWCVPVAVANSLWWLDSKYESIFNPAPTPPPTVSDRFGLVTAYGAWDDHSPNNVDPLVRNLAFLMDTDGQRSHDGHTGTRWTDIQNGINQYLKQQGVAGMFEVHNSSFADFAWIDNETEKCQDVELCLEFWQFTGGGWTNTTITNPSLELGHCVTCAGTNSTASQILISDPYQDAYEAGTTSGRSPVPHVYPHNSAVHNDAQYVSQDAYSATPFVFPVGPPPPPGYPGTVWELQGYLQTMGFDPSFHAFIRDAIATSPLGVHDVAITNHTSAKTIIGQGYCGNMTVTAQNQGSFAEIFNVTSYANTTSTNTLNFNLTSGNNATQGMMWNTTGFAYGNYTMNATADTVPGETNTSNNNFTCPVPVHVGVPGDVSSSTPGVYDGVVNMKDIAYMVALFNTKPGSPNWNPNVDVNNDGVVNMKDIAIGVAYFNKRE